MTVDSQMVLDGRYALDEVIGRGGMADVYRATDQLLLRPVAVKMLREIAEPGQRERFIAEARTLASLSHPGLITLLDAGILADRPYLVMELATGPTLSACIAEGPVDPERVRSVGRQLAEALAYAHDRGVVHRDIKPSNVLLCDDERVLLADFGIATLVGAVEHHTRTGDTIGSPAYLAPEQVAGEPIGPAADLFSLGLVLLESLTSVRAYTGSAIEAAMARLQAAPEIPDEIDPAWRLLIARMTRRNPEDRPAAAEVAAELAGLGPARPAVARLEQASIATGDLEVTQARRVPSAQSTDDEPLPGGPAPRRRVLWASVLAGLLATGALAAVLAISPWDHPQSSGSRTDVPSGVPSRLQQPLSDLHDAVDGHQP
ncbi:eukaryotic-like serine/threonine-protein kinase [Marmoricola sp. URHA0025 HA25]